ncbi:MAG: hypothetical protein OEZ01_04460 [Candidatus Heimdallarchaeota archaeon]|nr:hypothetical protein [Candidatus Heimdallarchaeota archaeon]MDH5645233.1 hypothetical protein [Candidatus Heimdallarchaeota archaeon]
MNTIIRLVLLSFLIITPDVALGDVENINEPINPGEIELQYELTNQNTTIGNIKFDSYDSTLGTRLSGYDTDIETVTNKTGNRSLISFEHNSTHRQLFGTDSYELNGYSSSTGVEFENDISGGDWIEVDENNSINEYYNDNLNWYGLMGNQSWQDIEDFRYANLMDYSSGISFEFREFSLSQVSETTNFETYNWLSNQSIVDTLEYNGNINVTSDILYKFEYYNYSTGIYRDTTDDIFNDTPYNVTREVMISFIQDPISGLYLGVTIDILFYFSVSASGEMEIFGTTFDADININMTMTSHTELILEDIISFISDDHEKPIITELWRGDDLPELMEWEITDNGIVNVTIAIDSNITQHFLIFREGYVSYNLTHIEGYWFNLKIKAIDLGGNEDSITYRNPNFLRQLSLPIVISLVIISSILIIRKRKLRKN